MKETSGRKKEATTIREVAREAAVSTATVSRALNGDARISAETSARVREAAKRLGYAVNRAARSLKTRATMTIGVIAPDLATDFFMILMERLEYELASKGYGMLISSSREDLEEERRLLGLFAERLVDGVIAIPATASSEHFREAVAAGTPLVLVDRSPRGAGADAVLVDNEGGAYAATMALAGLGHKRIGLIGGDPRLSTARERHAGFRRALAELGIPSEPEFEGFGPMHIESGFKLMEAMASKPKPPSAWFVVNADTHVGATSWLLTHGGRLADRVAFAAFDEMPYSPLLRFCRVSVEQPIADMGREAARLVLDRVAGRAEPKPLIVRLPTKLIMH
ncbi:MAG TPA: LacI family DNA-binding transcriptional regulator [Rectinemataceae bacterium]|nr:LacI family DNA-binding transcriptional regulator [Rectinemataceae bacterium]